MEIYAGTDKAESWRDEVKDWFSNNIDGVKIVSPTDYYNFSEKHHKTEKEVFLFDIHKVATSDLVLVNLHDVRKSIGTCVEIHQAYINNIPVIGFIERVPNENIEEVIHPWINFMVNRIENGVNGMEDAMQHIKDFYLI